MNKTHHPTANSGRVIGLNSITEANKARRQLSAHGFRCAVEKIHSRQHGCSYGVRVYGNAEQACRLLAAGGIYCGEVSP